MTEYELKSMNKTALIAEVLRLARDNEDMHDRVDRLQGQIRDLKGQLSDKAIRLQDAGSIAQAALSLNDVFASAQQAADQYLDSIRLMKEEQEAACARLRKETEEKCADMENGTRRRCDEMYRAAERDASEKWAGLAEKLETAMRDYIRDGAQARGTAGSEETP